MLISSLHPRWLRLTISASALLILGLPLLTRWATASADSAAKTSNSFPLSSNPFLSSGAARYKTAYWLTFFTPPTPPPNIGPDLYTSVNGIITQGSGTGSGINPNPGTNSIVIAGPGIIDYTVTVGNAMGAGTAVANDVKVTVPALNALSLE
ncbi:MAG: hypothetical protein U0Y68_00485 [Blastocatellia bacterium]